MRRLLFFSFLYFCYLWDSEWTCIVLPNAVLFMQNVQVVTWMVRNQDNYLSFLAAASLLSISAFNAALLPCPFSFSSNTHSKFENIFHFPNQIEASPISFGITKFSRFFLILFRSIIIKRLYQFHMFHLQKLLFIPLFEKWDAKKDIGTQITMTQ